MDFLEGKKLRIKCGYYYIGKKLLNRIIWEHFKGPIPPDHIIHHKNGDKLNNSIENLECLPRADHSRLHRLEESEVLSKRMSKNSEKIHEWHRSEEGRKSLAKKGRKEFERRIPKSFTCAQCGKEFLSKHNTVPKFCSDNCVSMARRLSGIDDETRQCIICLHEFTINKYQLTKTCSKPCRAKHIGNLKRKS